MKYRVGTACNRGHNGVDITILQGRPHKFGWDNSKPCAEFLCHHDNGRHAVLAPGRHDRLIGVEVTLSLVKDDVFTDTLGRSWKYETRSPDTPLPTLLTPIKFSVNWTNESRPCALQAVPEENPTYWLILEPANNADFYVNLA